MSTTQLIVLDQHTNMWNIILKDCDRGIGNILQVSDSFQWFDRSLRFIAMLSYDTFPYTVKAITHNPYITDRV